jgi:myosin heavy subunit
MFPFLPQMPHRRLPGVQSDSPCFHVSPRCLTVASQLFGVAPDILAKAIIKKRIVVGKDVAFKDLKPKECSEAAEAFVRYVYGTLFHWLVLKVNQAMDFKGDHGSLVAVGVLDIFGGENQFSE